MILKNEKGNCNCIMDSTIGWNIVYTLDDVHPNVMFVSFSSILRLEFEHQGTSSTTTAIVRFSLKLMLYDTLTKAGVVAGD